MKKITTDRARMTVLNQIYILDHRLGIRSNIDGVYLAMQPLQNLSLTRKSPYPLFYVQHWTRNGGKNLAGYTGGLQVEIQ